MKTTFKDTDFKALNEYLPMFDFQKLENGVYANEDCSMMLIVEGNQIKLNEDLRTVGFFPIPTTTEEVAALLCKFDVFSDMTPLTWALDYIESSLLGDTYALLNKHLNTSPFQFCEYVFWYGDKAYVDIDKVEKDNPEKTFFFMRVSPGSQSFQVGERKFIGALTICFNEFFFTSGLLQKGQFRRSQSKDFKTYIILDHHTGYYKIGRAKNPKAREKTLQAEKPTLELLFVIDQNIESELHKRFDAKRLRGEWFALDYHDIESIKKEYLFANQNDTAA